MKSEKKGNKKNYNLEHQCGKSLSVVFAQNYMTDILKKHYFNSNHIVKISISCACQMMFSDKVARSFLLGLSS